MKISSSFKSYALNIFNLALSCLGKHIVNLFFSCRLQNRTPPGHGRGRTLFLGARPLAGDAEASSRRRAPHQWTECVLGALERLRMGIQLEFHQYDFRTNNVLSKQYLASGMKFKVLLNQ